jgi:hypothetical protein
MVARARDARHASYTYDAPDRIVTGAGTTFGHDGIDPGPVTAPGTSTAYLPDGTPLSISAAGVSTFAQTDQHGDLTTTLNAASGGGPATTTA